MNARKGCLILWPAAALLFITAVIIGAGVIPIMGKYSSPYVRPGFFLNVCWGCVVFGGAAAIIVASIAARARTLRPAAGMLLASVMVLALLFSFGLSEAAFSFDSRGPALHMVAAFLHLCSAADFSVALLIVVAVILLPKRTKRTRGPSAC